MGLQIQRYVERFEDAPETAGQKDQEHGSGFGDLPDRLEARGGDKANQPSEEGTAKECDHQAEYAGGEEVEQRVGPARSGQEESGESGNQVERRHDRSEERRVGK